MKIDSLKLKWNICFSLTLLLTDLELHVADTAAADRLKAYRDRVEQLVEMETLNRTIGPIDDERKQQGVFWKGNGE